MSRDARYSWKAKLELDQEEKIVVAEIYKYNFIIKEPLWLTKLAELLKNDMKPEKVMRILKKLEELSYIQEEYGETEKGRTGSLIVIDTFESPSKEWSKKIYEEVEGGN